MTDAPSYYGQPVLKEPVWIWSVPAYFHVGGMAGAAAVLGAASQIGRRSARGLRRPARRVAAAGGLAGTILLVYDLGRPARFLNMLRVFRPTSPMSMGSWTLATFTPAAIASAVLGDGWLGDAAGAAAGLLGLPMSTYTSVLVSGTAVPAWRAVDRSLPRLFAASSGSSAGTLLEALAPDEDARRVARRFTRTAKATETSALAAVRRDARAAGPAASAFEEGLAGALWRATHALHAASLVLSFAPGRRGARRRWADAVVTSAAGLTLRFAVMHTGRASARDPHSVLTPAGGPRSPIPAPALPAR